MRYRWFIMLTLACLALAWFARPGQVISQQNQFVYLPTLAKPEEPTCAIPGSSYNTLAVLPPPTDRPAALHPDLNLAIRGYEPVVADLNLVTYAGGNDTNAPQLRWLFADGRLPDFSAAYQIYRWDWVCDCRGELYSRWPTTLLGMATTPGETIHVPDSGYNIGGGYDVLVLYASPQRITLKYTREDNVVYGYTVHIEDVCVEPGLLALYEAANAAGRGQLPALNGRQALGRAIGPEIKVSIRDAGSFLDPRSRRNWWADFAPDTFLLPGQ